MNNKFALSFGISLIFVGVLSFFFDTNNLILFSLSISTALFSVINIITSRIVDEELDLLYVLPFIFLVSFLCFSDSLLNNNFIKFIINSRITGALTFLSFGFLFVSEYEKYKREILKRRIHGLKLSVQDCKYSNLILLLVNDYMYNLKTKHKYLDEEDEEFLKKINKLCFEKTKLASINSDLLNLEKDLFTLDEFNTIYEKNSDNINYEKKMKKYHNRTKYKKNKNKK